MQRRKVRVDVQGIRDHTKFAKVRDGPLLDPSAIFARRAAISVQSRSPNTAMSVKSGSCDWRPLLDRVGGLRIEDEVILTRFPGRDNL